MYEWSSSESTNVILDRFAELQQNGFKFHMKNKKFRLSYKGNAIFILKGSIRDDEQIFNVQARAVIPIWLDLTLIFCSIGYFIFPIIPYKILNIVAGALLLFCFILFAKIRITGKFPKKATAPQYKENLLNAMNYAMNCEYQEIK